LILVQKDKHTASY